MAVEVSTFFLPNHDVTESSMTDGSPSKASHVVHIDAHRCGDASQHFPKIEIPRFYVKKHFNHLFGMTRIIGPFRQKMGS